MKRITLCFLLLALSVPAFARPMKDKRDGQTYETVKIGNQVWMAENLNYSVNPGEQSWCYKNEESNCKKYGRLYTWAAAVGKSEQQCGPWEYCNLRGRVQGICPSGWHVPSKEEFETLMNAVGGKDIAGKKLKSRSGWENNGNGTDDYGFSVLPAGFRGYDGDFDDVGYDAYLWTASENSGYYAWYLRFYYYSGYAGLDGGNKPNGFSVRCLKD